MASFWPSSTVTLWVASAPSTVSPRRLSGSTYFETSPATRSFLRIPSASAARSSLPTAVAGRRTKRAPSAAVFLGISQRYLKISRRQPRQDINTSEMSARPPAPTCRRKCSGRAAAEAVIAAQRLAAQQIARPRVHQAGRAGGLDGRHSGAGAAGGVVGAGTAARRAGGATAGARRVRRHRRRPGRRQRAAHARHALDLAAASPPPICTGCCRWWRRG